MLHNLDTPKVLFGDLHVHSDGTVGTGSSVHNFPYGREIAGLDVLGYTANDFQITKDRWESTLRLIQSLNKPDRSVIFQEQNDAETQPLGAATTLSSWRTQQPTPLNFNLTAMVMWLGLLKDSRMDPRISFLVLGCSMKCTLRMRMQRTVIF